MASISLVMSALVILLLKENTVNGLQCYRCTYNKISTGNSVVDKALQLVTSKITSDDSCLLRDDNDLDNIASGTCAPAADGKVKRCVVVKGKITFEVTVLIKINVLYETLTRDCVDVDESSEKEQANNKCFPEDKGSSGARTVINDYFEGLDVSKFDGEACYYQNSLGSELYPDGVVDTNIGSQLQCYSCSTNTIKTGQEIADKVINWVAKVVNDKYCSLSGSNDKYSIASKTCAAPSSQNKVNRCVTLKGEITLKLAGVDVVYETLTRDCAEVNKASEKAASNDKCYPEEYKSSIFQTIINDYFEGLQVDNFKGNGCYYENSLASEKQPEGSLLTSGQGRVTWVVCTTIILLIAHII